MGEDGREWEGGGEDLGLRLGTVAGYEGEVLVRGTAMPRTAVLEWEGCYVERLGRKVG